MGYKFQFITLAGFHVINLSMFELARAYKDGGMAAYSKVQQAEFAREAEGGYHAVKHQRFVGTGYFDQVAQCVAAGKSSTTALTGSTEEEQFELRRDDYGDARPEALTGSTEEEQFEPVGPRRIN